MLRESVRKLHERHAPPEYVRRLDKEQAYPYELYDAWIEAGLLAHAFPEAVGGENNGWDCVMSGLQVERVVASACRSRMPGPTSAPCARRRCATATSMSSTARNSGPPARQPGQRHQRLSQDRHRSALPQGHVAVDNDTPGEMRKSTCWAGAAPAPMKSICKVPADRIVGGETTAGIAGPQAVCPGPQAVRSSHRRLPGHRPHAGRHGDGGGGRALADVARRLVGR